MYDCPIIGCRNKTIGYLCSEHQELADRDDMTVVSCEKCFYPIKIEKRKKGEPKYRFTNGECLRCKPKIKEGE